MKRDSPVEEPAPATDQQFTVEHALISDVNGAYHPKGAVVTEAHLGDSAQRMLALGAVKPVD